MKKKRKHEWVPAFSLAMLLFVILLLGKQNSITGFTILFPSLVNGTFNNTYYNGESVQLNLLENFSEGVYTSQIIEFEEESYFNNFSWNNSECYNTIVQRINGTNETNSKKKPKHVNPLILYERQLVSNLTFFIKNCENITCENISWTPINNSSQLNISRKYLQYKFEFGTENLSCSPKLYSVEINYEVNNIINTSEQEDEPPTEEYIDSSGGGSTTKEVIKEEIKEEEINQVETEINEQEEIKEETLEVQQSPQKESQNPITGFFAFTKNNVLIINGFTLFMALFILLYIFVIRRRDFRMGLNSKKK